MKIFPGIVSGPKASPSLLYTQRMMGFCIALSTPTNQPITFYKTSQQNTSSSQVDYTEQSLDIKLSSLTGQFVLALSTCYYDTIASGYSSTGGFTTLFDDSNSIFDKLYSGFLLNSSPASTISSEFHHNASLHDHTSGLLGFHSTEAIQFNYPTDSGLLSSVGNTFTNSLVIPIPTSATNASYLISVIVHKHAIETPVGWQRIYRAKIDGETSGILERLREHQISVYVNQLSGTIPTDVTFKVIGS